jgi:outer membrane protein assembly factor BamB
MSGSGIAAFFAGISSWDISTMNSPSGITLLLFLLSSVSGIAAAQDNASDAAPAAPAQSVSSGTGPLIVSMPTLKKLWDAQALLNQRNDKTAWVTSDEYVVVVQSMRGLVTVLNAENGREYWSTQVGTADDVSLPAVTDRELVCIVCGPTLNVFAKFSGKRLFTWRLPQMASSAPMLVRREVVRGGLTRIVRWIYVPLFDGSVVAYDIDILERFGRLGTLPRDVWRAEQWRFVAGEDIRHGLTVGEERIAFATAVGNVFALDMFGARAGKARFQVLTRSSSSTATLLSKRNNLETLFAATSDGRLFAVDLGSSGNVLWSLGLQSAIRQPMFTSGSDLFVLMEDGVLAKLDVQSGDAAPRRSGTGLVLSHSQPRAGELRAYGASVELAIQGYSSFHPLKIANRSAGQEVRSLTIDLTRTPMTFVASAEDPAAGGFESLGNGSETTGLSSSTLSPDRRQLTLNFTSFQPNDLLYLKLKLEHPDMPSWKISDSNLAGIDIAAQVAPVRPPVDDSGSTVLQSFPPQTISGRTASRLDPWKVNGITRLLAFSDNVVYCLDRNGTVLAVNRDTAEVLGEQRLPDSDIQIFNDRTDRVIVSTLSGRVSAWAETRVMLGLMPLPTPAGLTWLLGPESELNPEFARFHRNPEARPVMPEVPAQDPQPEAPEGEQ